MILKKLLSLYKFDVKDDQLNEFAAYCFETYVGWFGPQQGPQWPYEIVFGPSNMCLRNCILRRYEIVIMKSYETNKQKFASIAHEMYHCVTKNRSSLIRFLWVDEMMAFVTSQRILRQRGYHDYADLRLKVAIESPDCMDILALKKAKARKTMFQIIYPDGFAAGVNTLGAELEKLVGWEAMTRLIQCISWKEWLYALSADVRPPVCQLLA